jgi:predicted nucleic acid-binding protein
VDACVLYSARTRDLLVSLAVSGAFRARWSPQVHEEWIRAVLARHADNPRVTRKKLERTRALMDSAVRNALVTGYRPRIQQVQLPDPNDLHVLAAAIHCGADLIVTVNLKHFPDTALARYGIRAVDPDRFIVELMTQNLMSVCQAVRKTRARLRNPPCTTAAYLAALRQVNLPATAAALGVFERFL